MAAIRSETVNVAVVKNGFRGNSHNLGDSTAPIEVHTNLYTLLVLLCNLVAVVVRIRR